jgi:hypothetical protein
MRIHLRAPHNLPRSFCILSPGRAAVWPQWLVLDRDDLSNALTISTHCALACR